MEFWWAFLVVGLTAGVLGSMLGVGGGILMVPVMYYFLKVDFKSASAMSLAVMIPMALAATLQNLRKPEIHIDTLPVVLMAVAAVLGAFGGTELAKVLPVMTLRRIFAVLMVLAAAHMAFFNPQKKAQTVPVAATTETVTK
ncbi:MAG TPA: sulfite exporter TauE/SafE family protein [Planctomycetota bacterium]|jgi:hypothetical protein